MRSRDLVWRDGVRRVHTSPDELALLEAARVIRETGSLIDNYAHRLSRHLGWVAARLHDWRRRPRV